MAMTTKRTLLERSFLQPWPGGPVRDWTTSPRAFTGRRKDASQAVAATLTEFLELHAIPLRAFSRFTGISGWFKFRLLSSPRSDFNVSPNNSILFSRRAKYFSWERF